MATSKAPTTHSALLPDPRLEPTITVPRAGKLVFGFGRAASYQAAARGDLPTIRSGRRRVVCPTAAILRMLQIGDPTGGPDAA